MLTLVLHIIVGYKKSESQMKKHQGLILFTLIIISSLIVGCSQKGESLYEFDAILVSGKSISKSDFKGKIIVINIWATWCGPCKNEIPELNALVSSYEDNEDIVFLAITDENTVKIEKFLGVNSFKYQQIIDGKELINHIHTSIIKSIPRHIIVDQKGIIRFEFDGAADNIESILAEEIEKLREGV